MKIPINTIGFSSIKEQKDIETLAEEIVLEEGTPQTTQLSEELSIMECVKKVAPYTYVIVRLSVEEIDDDEIVNIEDCDAFIESTITTEVQDIEIYTEGDFLYYGICEEKYSKTEIIFYIHNLVDYINKINKGYSPIGVGVVGIALEGTIILPTVMTLEDIKNSCEITTFSTAKERFQMGDTFIRRQLSEDEFNMEKEIKRRLLTEDLLTIRNAYFIPLIGIEFSIYAVLGTIIEINVRDNYETAEQMYVFTLDINEMLLEVVINKNMIVGLPSIGMRFLGTCWLQGTILLQK
ncbi:hypothetical protein AN639_01745 [Candidatus Epulonipiscium fishelsonii]|uniref:Uncharacterized protein n=1 Tax=Candidatus Epulonipiscium fishelsonii TaxID=77094 RepID=A0ACC8XE24_9FIRM|nr:hypothetical protein AN639_01745 [Epulopiscium sp. SCG-B05WGA-EpuloA1]ONI41225.1 hypothetical protein AN396_03825 [Epulopiscium sp. SCG-B11WGA-EpuloA1]